MLYELASVSNLIHFQTVRGGAEEFVLSKFGWNIRWSLWNMNSKPFMGRGHFYFLKIYKQMPLPTTITCTKLEICILICYLVLTVQFFAQRHFVGVTKFRFWPSAISTSSECQENVHQVSLRDLNFLLKISLARTDGNAFSYILYIYIQLHLPVFYVSASILWNSKKWASTFSICAFIVL